MDLNMMQFRSILLLSADEPGLLRPSDVERIMDAAHDQGCLEEFREWLLSHTDLKYRILNLYQITQGSFDVWCVPGSNLRRDWLFSHEGSAL